MSDNKKVSQLLEMLLMTIVMFFFIMISMTYIPYVVVLAPAPFIVYNIKNSSFLGIVSYLLVSLAIGVLVSMDVGLIILLMFLPLIISTTYMVEKKETSYNIIIVGILVFFVSMLVLLGLSNTGEAGIAKELEESVSGLVSSQIDLFKDMDFSKSELGNIEDMLENAYKYIIMITPAILLIMSLVVSYLNLLLTSIGLERLDINIISTPKFSRFRLPKTIIPGSLFLFIVLMIMDKMGIQYTDVATVNLVVLFMFAVLIQGLAVVDFYLSKRMFILFRILIYGILLFIPMVVTIINVLGFMDILMNFRKIDKPGV